MRHFQLITIATCLLSGACASPAKLAATPDAASAPGPAASPLATGDDTCTALFRRLPKDEAAPVRGKAVAIQVDSATGLSRGREVRVYPTTTRMELGELVGRLTATVGEPEVYPWGFDVLLEHRASGRQFIVSGSADWGASFKVEGQAVRTDVLELPLAEMRRRYPDGGYYIKGDIGEKHVVTIEPELEGALVAFESCMQAKPPAEKSVVLESDEGLSRVGWQNGRAVWTLLPFDEAFDLRFSEVARQPTWFPAPTRAAFAERGSHIANLLDVWDNQEGAADTTSPRFRQLRDRWRVEVEALVAYGTSLLAAATRDTKALRDAGFAAAFLVNAGKQHGLGTEALYEKLAPLAAHSPVED
jgi:hypothetical protein